MPRLSPPGGPAVNGNPRENHCARSPSGARTGMLPARRTPMKPMVCAAVLLAFIGAARAADLDWQLFQDTSVIEILTHDEGGALRETSVWIVPLAGHGYVRTNDSRW